MIEDTDSLSFLAGLMSKALAFWPDIAFLCESINGQIGRMLDFMVSKYNDISNFLIGRLRAQV